MYFETDRLHREDKQEAIMPTERVPCVKCGKVIPVVADEDRVVIIECKHCGHKFEVVIESKSNRAA
jgi:transcription elongation factor Elf1